MILSAQGDGFDRSESDRREGGPSEPRIGGVKSGTPVEGIREMDRIEHGGHLAGVEGLGRGEEDVPILQVKEGLGRAQGLHESEAESLRDEEELQGH